MNDGLGFWLAVSVKKNNQTVVQLLSLPPLNEKRQSKKHGRARVIFRLAVGTFYSRRKLISRVKVEEEAKFVIREAWLRLEAHAVKPNSSIQSAASGKR